METFNKKCPFNREPCDPDCAILVEHITDGVDFGFCGLLGPLLKKGDGDLDFPVTGQHIYPSFSISTEEDSTNDTISE